MNKVAFSLKFEVVFVWQTRANGKRKHDLWLLLSPYKSIWTERCYPERYTNFQPGMKSWTSTIIMWYIYIRGGTLHVFVPNCHSMDILVRCMRPYDEYRQFTPNPEGGTRSNATLFDNCQRQQKNSETCQSDAHEFRYYSNSRVFFQNHPGSNSVNIKIKWCVIKGIVHPIIQILSSFTHPQVVPNLY